jgi:hypothetical protein
MSTPTSSTWTLWRVGLFCFAAIGLWTVLPPLFDSWRGGRKAWRTHLEPVTVGHVR